MKRLRFLWLFLIFIWGGNFVSGQNPFITHIYTADPTARVFNDTLYVYPSHDIQCEPGFGENGFCMEDYHVFSTTDFGEWTDHGVILTQEDAAWIMPESYSMWAPDCIEKDGKYYFYFPAKPKDGTAFMRVGIAVADHPTGPFTVRQSYLPTVKGIDPGLFVDDDGTPYLYFAGGGTLQVVKLREDMMGLASPVQNVIHLPSEGYKEGPFLFKRDSIYYFTFPHAPFGSEEIAYAMGSSPTGPFTYKGKIMDRWTDGCWTNHHSIVEYKGLWYMFYHHHDLSGDQTLRSIRVDRLFFNEDGTIRKVVPTREGVSSDSLDPVRVEFRIWDSYAQEPIEGARVRFGEWEALTDQEGWVVFEELWPTPYAFHISADGYVSSPLRSITPREDSLISVSLSPQRYRLDFQVSEEKAGIPVSGASITVGEFMVKTDINGEVSIFLPADSLNFAVSKSNFNSAHGSLDFYTDTTLQLKLIRVGADVKFRVLHHTQRISTAEITIGSETQFTSQIGIAWFFGLAVDSLLFYSVTKDGYPSYEDSFSLSADSTIEVTLAGVGSESLSSQNQLTLYPNPASQMIQIDGLQVPSVLELLDHTGKLIRSVEANSSPFKISVGELAEGIYFIRTEHHKHLFFIKH